MRSLRSGQTLNPPAAAVKPAATAAAAPAGLAKDDGAFVAELNRAIAEAGQSGERVFVFRLQGVVKGLQRWSGNDTISSETVRRSVEALIMASDPDLLLWRVPGGDLLGFDPNPKPGAVAERIGGRLMTGLASPLGPPGRQFILSPRLGICIFDPADGTAEQAIEAVTRTVVQTTFGTPFLVYNRYIAERSIREDRTAEELPEALSSGAITVEFQPRVISGDHKTAGLEMLPRWYHPDRGSIPPTEFLRVAEQKGFLVDLGRRLRDDAVALARDWQADELLGDCRLWMNVAPLELCHPELIPSMTELAEARPQLPLGLEVADSRLLEDLVFLRIFDRLQELGVQLALDNVNTYSLSFGRLRRLPLSMINLDGELVRSLPSVTTNRELVRLICNSAAERGTLVTACGVETTEQLEVAERTGVDLVQGYAVAGLRPAKEMAHYLSGHK
ncbi:MAG: EAL domain-containing protein [Acidimicrobiales bacterium]